MFLCLMLVFATFSIAGTELAFGFALLFFILKKIAQRPSWKRIIPQTRLAEDPRLRREASGESRRASLNLPIFCFLAACLISSVISIEPKRSFCALITKTLEYAAIYFLFVESIGFNKKRFNIILILLFASCGLSIFNGLFQQFQGVDFLRQRPLINGWVTAGFKYYNDFGGYLILVLPLILGALFYKKIKLTIRSFAILPLAILAGLCLALTYSRGAWIGFVVGFIFLFIYIFIYLANPRQRIYLPILIAALCAVIFFLIPPPMKERMMSIVHMQSAGRLGEGGLWMQAIRLVGHRIFLGQGLGIYMDMSSGTYAHNCYLQMLAEIGIIGLASFLWIIGRLFKLGIRSFKESRDPLLLGLLGGIIAFLAHSFFDTNLYSLQLSVLFWSMLGLAVARVKCNKK